MSNRFQLCPSLRLYRQLAAYVRCIRFPFARQIKFVSYNYDDLGACTSFLQYIDRADRQLQSDLNDFDRDLRRSSNRRRKAKADNVSCTCTDVTEGLLEPITDILDVIPDNPTPAGVCDQAIDQIVESLKTRACRKASIFGPIAESFCETLVGIAETIAEPVINKVKRFCTSILSSILDVLNLNGVFRNVLTHLKTVKDRGQGLADVADRICGPIVCPDDSFDACELVAADANKKISKINVDQATCDAVAKLSSASKHTASLVVMLLLVVGHAFMRA
eukprot:TRINITY_DN11983_c0_g1_i1.p1 TRINITY_DN11983_c0_g1~~TRINITY_DN11983_c0_g1_i1.p1  ORF type:complete len:277 (+),score=39.11 TRINITY_DN11983_c0_g1_i1:200-1030(+)